MASPIYRFGEFQLDPAIRELRRSDEELSLPPKAFGCLVYRWFGCGLGTMLYWTQHVVP